MYIRAIFKKGSKRTEKEIRLWYNGDMYIITRDCYALLWFDLIALIWFDGVFD